VCDGVSRMAGSISLVALALLSASAQAATIPLLPRFTSDSSATGSSYKVTYVSLPRVAHKQASHVIPPAQFSAPFVAKQPRRKHKVHALNAVRHRKSASREASSSSGGDDEEAPVSGSGGDSQYLANVTIGGQDFALIIDTGSSDTWVAQKGFTCINLASKLEKESHCAFGDLFDPSQSSTIQPVDNANFNITYGDGEFLNGVPAKDTVSVAGLTVPGQEISLVNRAAWFGDGVCIS
jgi:hypothetical protein